MPENLVAAEGQLVEFVLLNYSSPDACEEWVIGTMREHIKSGKVTYYHYEGAKYFHHAHAKNLAHRLARGTILCNLDADNYIGRGFPEYLINAITRKPRRFVRSTLGEVFGRIALLKSDFLSLGGYDERMGCGWGMEDVDLVTRAKAFGLKEIAITNREFLRIIRHGESERTRFTPVKNSKESDAIHRRISVDALANGKLIANAGVAWGSGKIIENFNQIKVI